MIDIEEIKEEIITNLKEQGYANKFVDYSELLKLYESYRTIVTIDEFVELLGINRPRFRAIRLTGGRTKILEQKATEELKEVIRAELRNAGFANKKITYLEFLQLYEKYKNSIAEREFANIIGITDDRYKSIKNRGSRTTVLATKIDEPSIASEVRERYGEVRIDYNEFLTIYDQYKAKVNDEIKFAWIIGIPRSSFNSMKKQGIRARMFGVYVPQEIYEEIRNQILMQGYSNKQVNYTEFLSLYSQYSEKVSERQFVNILGISECMYSNMRYNDGKAKILAVKRKITPELKKKIEEELIAQGYVNTTIDYLKFQQLYESYAKEISEREFAEALGMSYFSFGVMKNKGARAVILKKENCIDLLQYYHDIGLSGKDAIKRVSEELELDGQAVLKIMNKELSTRGKKEQEERDK